MVSEGFGDLGESTVFLLGDGVRGVTWVWIPGFLSFRIVEERE